MLLYIELSRLTFSCADLVQAAFLWYKHMHALMGTSPVVSKAALAHSTSEVDLSVLSRDGGGDDEGSENKSSNGDEVCLPKHFLHPTNTNNLSAQPPSRPCHESLPWDIERPSSLDNSHSGSPGYDTLSNKEMNHPLHLKKHLPNPLLENCLSNIKACMTSSNWLQILRPRLITRLRKCRQKKEGIVLITRPTPNGRMHLRLNTFAYNFNMRSRYVTMKT